MYKIHDITQSVPDVPHPYTFPIDPFQKHAFHCIANDENVLVTAKTGSGKTLVGEYQIYHSLKKGKRVFYTTPIKSLSNQKFHDLKQIHPSVGIMTGDIKFCPHADIVILTTEILRNLLYKQGSVTESIGITANLSLDNVDAIIFDEVHYINDPSRGNVWEECFILMPKEIRLVLLSATLDHPDTFAKWLGELKQVAMHVISTEYRVVPLIHKLGKEVLMDEKNTFHDSVYTNYMRHIADLQLKHDKRKDAVRNRQEGEQVIAKGEQIHSFIHQMNEQIAMLNTENLLPALFFVFSRKKCMHYANSVTHDLLSSTDTASVRHILSFHLHRYPDLQKLPQYHDLEKLLLKGIAYHHSGLLPILKEIIEILFARGFVKLLFATETFAVGINMPTKTVVFTSFRKYDDLHQDERILRTDEYLQMAGRAGRRGKDTVGYVFYLPDITMRREPLVVVKDMMTGRPATVSSQMTFGYEFLLKALHSERLTWNGLLTASYWQALNEEQAKKLETQRETLLAKKPVLEPDCDQRYALEQEFKNGNRKVQGAIETWKNRHPGPKWETAWKQYAAWKQSENLICAIEVNIRTFREPPAMLLHRLDYLERTGFVKDGRLTQLGHMAADINEGNPLVMARAFHEKALHGCSAHDLVAILCCFIEGKPDGYPPQLMDIYLDLKKKETVGQQEWLCYNTWCDPIYEWLEGQDFGAVCEIYEVDAGNLSRAILKAANLLDEWVNMATYCEDLEMLEKCRGVRETLIRGLVVPDSLYLRV